MVSKSKNNKIARLAKVIAKMIKYSLKEICGLIARILQLTFCGKKHPAHLRTGNALPLPKVPPVILLSMMRKITSMYIVNRCWDRLKSEIAIDQATYHRGRSTTERLYTVKKNLAEKAIFSSDYTIFVLMLDMLETLDSINRTKLIDYLGEIQHESELYMMYILINEETGNR